MLFGRELPIEGLSGECRVQQFITVTFGLIARKQNQIQYPLIKLSTKHAGQKEIEK